MKYVTTLAVLISAAGATAASAATATPTDRAFVAKVSQGGMFEVNSGKLAETKGATQDVRDFAATEVHDHVLVGDKLKAMLLTSLLVAPLILKTGLKPPGSAKKIFIQIQNLIRQLPNLPKPLDNLT